MELVKFCERLETAEELFQTQGEVNHQNKNSSSPANATNLAQRKGSYEAANPSDEDANKNKNQKKKSPVCPLHGPGHDMNSCKVMLAQAKAMRSTWSTARRGGAGRVRFQGAKKRPYEDEELNALIDNAVKVVLTTKTFKKAKDSSDSVSEDYQEHFNFKTLKIR